METNNPEPKYSKAQAWVWRTVSNIARDPTRRREAIAMAEQALAAPGELLDYEIPGVERTRNRWLWSLDPDFQPSQYSRLDAAEVLEIKSKDCAYAGDYNTAVRYAWERWQYSNVGTIHFCHALSDLADCAAWAHNSMLVQHIVPLYRLHYDLLHSAVNEPATPVRYSSMTSLALSAEHLHPLHFNIPVSAALYGMAFHPHSHWAWVLELAVYKVPFRKGRYEARLQKAAAALVPYYTETGNTEALDRLNAYLIETQPEEIESQH
jgi:hypothetical protein